jgi:hypothetical protein
VPNRKLWLVSPLELQQDPTKPAIFGDGLGGEVVNGDNGLLDEAQPIAPARGRFLPPRGVRENAPDGYYLTGNSKKEIEAAFFNREAAQNHAKKLAELKPTIQYAVFECVGVFETTVPEVIEKEFTEDGELRVRGK